MRMAETKKAKPARKATGRKARASATAAAKPAAKKPVRKATARPVAKKPSRPAPRAKPRTAPRRAKQESSSGFDIVKLIDHPLVADLLAVGAMAAVAAIADHHVKTRTGEAESGSSKAVKAAGKAAAAAIGKRLLTEVDAVRKVSTAKGAKPGLK